MKMWSERVADMQPEGAYLVSEMARDIEDCGLDVVHLEIGQPDFDVAGHVSLAGVKAITLNNDRYAPPRGTKGLIDAIAQEASFRRGVTIRPTQIVVGPGAKPGLFFTTLALIDKGDEVLIPDPGFPAYRAMVQAAGGTPVSLPLCEEKGFTIDLDAFDSLITDRTKMVVLNSPANPTGAVLPIEDLKHIAAASAKYGLWVISDEIYSRFAFGNAAPASIAGLEGMLNNTVIVDGFSKAYSMTGWRLGYAIMPEFLAEKVAILLTHAIGPTATFVQHAGVAAIRGPQGYVEEAIMKYRKNRDYLTTELNRIAGVKCQLPMGAFYCFPNVKAFGMLSKILAQRALAEVGLAVLPGTDFGQRGEGYLRLCYATSWEKLNEGVARLTTLLSRL